eukprot:2677914-Prorocentrum_lima.AAC.2
MHDEGIGYGSINHPVDTCQACGYKGVIYDKCPVCQSENIMLMRRITGYLTGDLSTWNSAKRAEERDRSTVKASAIPSIWPDAVTIVAVARIPNPGIHRQALRSHRKK